MSGIGDGSVFVLDVGMDRLDDERLLRFGQLAEIDIEVLQRLVVRIDIVIVIVGFAEQIVGRGIEDVRNLDDLLEGRTRAADLPAADRRLLDAEPLSQFTLSRVVLFAQSL